MPLKIDYDVSVKIEGLKLRPIPDYGDVMLTEEFVQCVQTGLFTNYDGSGYYATKTHVTDVPAVPSDIMAGKVRKFSRVVWFSK